MRSYSKSWIQNLFCKR